MANIAINTSYLSPLNQSRGIGIYSQELLKALRGSDPKNHYLLATTKSQLQSVDLIHYPNFDFFFHTLPIKKVSKTVVTIHDVIPLIFSNHFQPGIRGKLQLALQKKSLKNTHAIITDSKNSKQDIIKYLNIPSHKIHVVYLAASPKFKKITSAVQLSITKKKYHLTKSFILYVGDVNYNKNVPTLIQAFSKLNTNHDLVLISKAWKNTHIPEIKTLTNKISHYNLGSRIKTISNLPTDSVQDLVNIYNLAAFYVQPSLYEGFGLPVLEAMASGTPVVTSSAASLPEVAGKGAILVKPDLSSLIQGINQALSMSPSQKKNLITQGYSQAKKFSWQKTAQQTIRVYQSVLKSS